VISPLTFDEAAAVLEACVTARQLPEAEVVDEPLESEQSFRPWQPQRIWTAPARAAASASHRRPKAPAR
jgi:hypothetical protein